MEVIYDLDVVARQICDELGIRMARALTVETHPAMIEMIVEMLDTEPAACHAGCCARSVRPT
jgi:ferrochelatase